MKINGFQVPAELEVDLAVGGRKLSTEEMSRFRNMLSYVESPLPKLYDYEAILRENRLWNSDSVEFYIGSISDVVDPGNIDPDRTLIIGQAEPDSPIALDYRTACPRVVYFGDVDFVSCWIEVSGDYPGLLRMLRHEA